MNIGVQSCNISNKHCIKQIREKLELIIRCIDKNLFNKIRGNHRHDEEEEYDTIGAVVDWLLGCVSGV